MFIFPGMCVAVFVARTIPRNDLFQDLTKSDKVEYNEAKTAELGFYDLVTTAIQSAHATRTQKLIMVCGVLLTLIGIVVFVVGLIIACIEV